MDHNLYFKIFEKKDSPDFWEAHVKYAGSCTDIPEKIRIDWIEAIKFMQHELGNKFLKYCSKQHPILSLINNKSEAGAKELISINKILFELKNTNSGYERLKKKLISEVNCKTEGIPFIETIEIFVGIGFKARLVDENRYQRTPDLEVTNPENNERFYVEISGLGNSDERKKINQNFLTFYNVFENHDLCLPYSFAQLELLSDDEMNYVLKIIKESFKKVINEKSVIYIHHNKFRLGIADHSRYSELHKWIKDNDYSSGLLGVPLNFNETYRISNNKIGKKADQIPSMSTGIICTLVNPLFFWNIDIDEAISACGKSMKKFPDLFGIILYASIYDDEEQFSIRIAEDYYGMKKMHGVLSRYLLFIKNPGFKANISKETCEKIYQAFL